MPAKRATRWVVAAGLAVMVAACAAPAPPSDRFHRLDVQLPAQRFAQPVLPGVLEVTRLDAEGMLSERALAYQDLDGALSRYRYDLWAEVPSVMLQEHLIEAMRRSGVASTLVSPDLRVPPDWVLRGRISRFEMVPSEGVAKVRVRLAVVSARDGSLVLQETYDAQAPAIADPLSEAKAIGTACGEVLNRFVADLARVSKP